MIRFFLNESIHPERATDGELMQMGQISEIISEIKEPNWSMNPDWSKHAALVKTANCENLLYIHCHGIGCVNIHIL